MFSILNHFNEFDWLAKTRILFSNKIYGDEIKDFENKIGVGPKYNEKSSFNSGLTIKNVVETNRRILKANFQPIEFLCLFLLYHDEFFQGFGREYFVVLMYNQNNHGLVVIHKIQQDCPNIGTDVYDLDFVAVAAFLIDFHWLNQAKNMLSKS